MKRTFHLIVDIGNSTTSYALFEGDKYLAHQVLSTYEENKKVFKKAFKTLVKKFEEANYSIDNGMIFSVVPQQTNLIKGIVKKYLKVKTKFFNWQKYDFQYKDEKITDKIGADLIADLVAAEQYYGHPALIVDLGTVNKLLLTDMHGTFVGASFTAGINSQLRLLANDTALLPKVNGFEGVSKELGYDTIGSIKHGVYWEIISYINHEHEVQEKAFKNPVYLILTGGNAEFVKDDIENKTYDPLLTLKGMNYLYLESIKK